MMTMWICLRPRWSMMFSTDCAYTEFRAYRSNQTLFLRFSNEVPVFFNVFVHTFFLHGWAGTLTMAKSLWRECWSMMPSLLSTDIEVIYILEPWQWHPRLRTNVQSRSFWQQASTQSICDDWIKIAPAALICMSWSKSSDIVGVLHKCHAFFFVEISVYL